MAYTDVPDYTPESYPANPVAQTIVTTNLVQPPPPPAPAAPNVEDLFEDVNFQFDEYHYKNEVQLALQQKIGLPLPAKPSKGSFPLSSSVYLEKSDPSRHAGMWLGWIYQFWMALPNQSVPFWQFVGQVTESYSLFQGIVEQEAKKNHEHPLSDSIYFHLFKRGVKYVAEGAKRDKYRVVLGYRLRRPDGTYIDSAKIRSTYSTRYSERVTDFRKDPSTYNMLHPGKSPNLLSKAGPGAEFGNDWLIWVWGNDNQFYTHVGKLGRFHHSSFVGGEAVKAAGEWRVEDGKLKGIVGLSGHYKPPFEALTDTLRFLQSKKAVIHDQTKVYLWEKNSVKVVDILAWDFLAKPSYYESKYIIHQK